jgi:exopolysaccharide production protein ExoY
MKSRLVRLLLTVVTLIGVVVLCYLLRRLMIVALTPHSFWHYLARSVLLLGAAVTAIMVIQQFSIRNPAETIGVSSTPSVGFKISNFAKRVTDIVVAVSLLTVLSPLLFFIAILIFILEGYPIFYISKRYISLDQCVPVLKFRTMVRDATSPKYRLRERYMREGYLDIPLDCEVYTPLGRILERTQLVEILQLFNIVLHRMSLIGNRPLPADNIQLLRQFPGWEQRFDSPAGITGLSQVVGKLNQTPQQRLELESMYSKMYKTKGANIYICDLYIAYYTVRLLLTGETLDITDAKNLVESLS